MTQGRGLIYYVEDDEHIRNMTAYALEHAGYEVRTFPDGTGFVETCAQEPPDAILLDIMLPGVDGLEILRALRSSDASSCVPVMMLTAKGTEFDTVSGLDAGADDYLAKPFGVMELISRVNALLRRSGIADARAQRAHGGAGGSRHDADDMIAKGPIALSPSSHRAWAGDNPLALTAKEFDLLRVLMENEGHVLSRDQLLDIVWETSFVGETRTVDVHIKTLRRKLAQACPGCEKAIATIRGVGYVLRADEA